MVELVVVLRLLSALSLSCRTEVLVRNKQAQERIFYPRLNNDVIKIYSSTLT